MYLTLTGIIIIISIKYADWKHWEKYQSTMLLFGFGNLLYNFLYCDHYLWQWKAEFFSFEVTEVIFSFSVFPITSLLFLTNYPKGFLRQGLRIVKFIIIYILIEFLFFKTGRILYGNGWNFWWSIAWDCMMFPVLALHYKRPVIAYMICILIIFIMHWLFPFPFPVMETRH